jgi:hypothetical protein
MARFRAEPDNRSAIVKEDNFWDIYKATRVPGLPDISYKIPEDKQAEIDTIVENFLKLTPEQKFYMGEKDFWLYRIRTTLNINQPVLIQYFQEHGDPNPSPAWLGLWERSAKDETLAPHQYFRLPTSIVGSPERVIILSRVLGIDLTDMLILNGYPLRRNKDVEKVVAEALEKQAKEHVKDMEKLEAEFNEALKRRLEEEAEKSKENELKADEMRKQLELIYIYVQRKDADPKLKTLIETFADLND